MSGAAVWSRARRLTTAAAVAATSATAVVVALGAVSSLAADPPAAETCEALGATFSPGPPTTGTVHRAFAEDLGPPLFLFDETSLYSVAEAADRWPDHDEAVEELDRHGFVFGLTRYWATEADETQVDVVALQFATSSGAAGYLREQLAEGCGALQLLEAAPTGVVLGQVVEPAGTGLPQRWRALVVAGDLAVQIEMTGSQPLARVEAERLADQVLQPAGPAG